MMLNSTKKEPVREGDLNQPAGTTGCQQPKAILQQHAEELSALNALGKALIFTFSEEQTVRVGLQGMITAVQPDVAFVFLRKGESLILQDFLPPTAQLRPGNIPEHRVGECICGMVVRENRSIFSKNIFEDPRCTWTECRQAGIRSVAALPLQSGEEAIGVIGLASDTERDFEQQADFLETLASQVAVSLVKTRLFEAVQKELSERKQAETAAHREREMCQTLLQHAPIAILMIDGSGRFTYANPKFTEIFGYDLSDVPDGRTWFRKAYPEAVYRKQVISDWLNDLKMYSPGEHRPRVYDVICKNGGKKNIKFIPVGLENGKNLVVLEDITERLILEDQLQHAQKMEAVGILAGGVAHDFNNLLQAISGYTQLLLLNKPDSDPDASRLKAIEKSISRAAQLVRQLLLFSRKDAAERRNVHLSHEIVQVVKLLERTIPRMIEIELQPAGDLWTVNADPSQIEQALMNLGINAADAMPDGGKLIIRTRNERLEKSHLRQLVGAPEGDYVVLTVTDTGCGMDKETLDHIFEPFFTTKGIGKGTGLGLASVYGIVKGHRGYIHCRSVVGRGTTFEIYLPAVLQESTDSHQPIACEAPLKGGAGTILIVDDVPDIRNLTSEFMKGYGYAVLTAASGEEALQIHAGCNKPIDLTILDLGMPGIGGSRCLQELLAMNPASKVLIASGYRSDDMVQTVLESGASGFIGKPYNFNELLSRVQDILDGTDTVIVS